LALVHPPGDGDQHEPEWVENTLRIQSSLSRPPGSGRTSSQIHADPVFGPYDAACAAKPDTILAWYQRLVARKFDGSRQRAYPGRPRISPEVEALVVRFARENRSWGYDRVVGAPADLGYEVSDQTVGNIVRRHDIARSTTWKEFIESHTDVLAGADFFTVEVLTWRGLGTYYVLFFIELGSRRIRLDGITRHPDSRWMEQVARNATMQDT
jgi:putative transposase